jgi:hypothetical protein
VRDGEQQTGPETPLEPDRELIFYYNRDRRLERASPEVRAMNEGKPLMRGGVIRSLTSTRPHQILLVTIVLISVWILVFSHVSGSRDRVTLLGNTLQAGASGSGEPFIIIKKRVISGTEAPYTGEVYVGVSPFAKSSEKINPADIPVFTAQLFFTFEEEEEYRLDLPFSAETYLALFQAGDQRASLRVRAGNN